MQGMVLPFWAFDPMHLWRLEKRVVTRAGWLSKPFMAAAGFRDVVWLIYVHCHISCSKYRDILNFGGIPFDSFYSCSFTQVFACPGNFICSFILQRCREKNSVHAKLPPFSGNCPRCWGDPEIPEGGFCIDMLWPRWDAEIKDFHNLAIWGNRTKRYKKSGGMKNAYVQVGAGFLTWTFYDDDLWSIWLLKVLAFFSTFGCCQTYRYRYRTITFPRWVVPLRWAWRWGSSSTEKGPQDRRMPFCGNPGRSIPAAFEPRRLPCRWKHVILGNPWVKLCKIQTEMSNCVKVSYFK